MLVAEVAVILFTAPHKLMGAEQTISLSRKNENRAELRDASEDVGKLIISANTLDGNITKLGLLKHHYIIYIKFEENGYINTINNKI
jgi:hypothetical protein